MSVLCLVYCLAYFLTLRHYRLKYFIEGKVPLIYVGLKGAGSSKKSVPFLISISRPVW